MGTLTDRIRDLLRLPGAGAGSLVQFVDSRGLFEDYVQGLSAEDLYRTQPALRTVISFLGRNVAQLGVHTFKRVSDTDRVRDRESPVAKVLRRPNATMTGYDLINRLVCDIGTYDDAYWVVEESLDTDSGWSIQPIPPSWVARLSGGNLWAPDTMWVLPPGAPQAYPVPMENVIRFHGWDPTNLNRGSSPVNALKATLMEQVHAVKYRDQMWTRAGRVGVTVTRPAMSSGTNWSPEQKKAFKDVLDSKLSGDSGADAGGSIILEDGMTMDRLGFTAHENEFVEASKLNLATVAQVYHVNPTMIGMLDNANFSNVREFNRSLYTNTLGPIMAMIEDRLNAFLVPRLERGAADVYVEFNIAEKLQGSFEEQAAVMQSATGRPWQTVNETRGRFNMPAIEGGDDLSIPLNVLLGGPGGDPSAPAITQGAAGFTPGALKMLAELEPAQLEAVLKSLEGAPGKSLPVLDAPRVAGSKDRAPAAHEAKAAELLKRHFARQRKTITAHLGTAAALGKSGTKASPDWWDGARWDRELGDDLFKLAAMTATQIGQETAASLGFSPGDYDQDRTLAFLKAVAASRAQAVNAATLAALEDAITAEDPTAAVDSVFTVAEDQRSTAGAAALVTMLAAFATVETGKQLGGDKGVKVWHTNSKNPRPEHARMAGERVPLGAKFSNGADWPGDPALGADGVAGCRCSVELIIE